MKDFNFKEIIKLGINLGIICLIGAFTLSITYSITRDRIDFQRKQEIINAQLRIFPDATFQKIEIPEFNESKLTIRDVYRAINKDKKEIGFIAISTTQGYGGSILFVIGVNEDKTIKDIIITEQTETPGLGANIAKDKFLKQFINKSYTDKFKVKEDIIPVTSATISSRSITQGIKATLDYLTSGNLEKNK
jgi:Na+-translocating ferredoxin:NAD+ oxidoreductase subunit G